MADLAFERTEDNNPPFTYVGVDCFGPFLTKRGRSTEKRYGCLFTCLSTRAVHIEMLHSLEADTFLNGLSRLIARRGKPRRIRCDNGTNFKGAFNELKASVDAWNRSVEQRLTQRQIEWIFNTPSASHQGGCWERIIRSVRRVINAILHGTVLDDERLTTIFCEVESILNNRPITPNSTDNKDDEPLTPNHLLLLRSNSTAPPGIFTKIDNYTRRWRHAQYVADRFWKRWIKEYLPIIQHRQKWLKTERNFRINDIVLICDDLTARNNWPLARITDVTPGRDGQVRTVTLRTQHGIYRRPITKICLLEQAQ